ncbi:MAG TPA: SpoIVB peptidase S55 domain-containing protein [Vicinamibacterales bacterium]
MAIPSHPRAETSKGKTVHVMGFGRAFLTLSLALLALLPLRAAAPLMPVSEIKPGMVGVGRTVFTGSRLEEFKVHILGVLENVMGPSRNLILARLEGGPLEKTGVIAGMSGSPVYVDGRLIGAVSYSLGAFSREPIAGITPIEEMIDATRTTSRRAPGTQASLTLPVSTASLASTLQDVFARTPPFAQSPADVRPAALGPGVAPDLATMLRPISTPLVMGGFRGDVATMIATAFSSSGFTPMAAGGGTAPDAPELDRPLQPGDAIGVGLIDGDLSLGGTGTVTAVEGDRVYAFGHPFYNLGPTKFPMTRAWIHTLLPSLMNSSKLGSLGRVIGTFEQDRATAIAGTLGPGPSMLPIRLVLDTDRGPRREFRFSVVRDQLFTPLLTYLTVVNTLKSYEREFGTASFVVTGRALVAKHGEIAFEDIFTGESPSVGAASYIAGPITFLLKNEFEPVEIDELDLRIVSSEEPRTAVLERVWLDAPTVRPGRSVPVKLLMRTSRGEDVLHTVPVDIPVNASGTLTLIVADGARLAQIEQRETRQTQRAQDAAQIVKAFNKARKNNHLYVRLVSSEPGAVVSGETLSALPPSVLAVLDADRHGGSIGSLRSATLGEWAIPTDYAVSGARFLSLPLR